MNNKILSRLLLFFCILFFSSTGLSQSSTADPLLQKKQGSLPHATFYFYRSFVPLLMKSVKKIPVYINDSLVYNLKANTYIAIKVFKAATYTVAVDKKGQTDTQVKVKLGNDYFFRCDGLGGFLNFKTTIDAVSVETGRKETGVLTSE